MMAGRKFNGVSWSIAALICMQSLPLLWLFTAGVLASMVLLFQV